MRTIDYLDQLTKAHAEGTADGPWRFQDNGTRHGPENRYEILDDEGSVAVCSADNDATQSNGFDRTALIVAAVNALPQITAALRAVLSQCDRADTLAEYRPGLIETTALRTAITDALGGAA